VDYVKTDLMPDFDFDAFNHDEVEGEMDQQEQQNPSAAPVEVPTNTDIVDTVIPETTIPAASTDEVDKW
jgi:hypothetical protein